MQSNAESVLSKSDRIVCDIPEVAMNERSKQHLDLQLKQSIITLRIMCGFYGDESVDTRSDSAEKQSQHGEQDSHNADDSSVDEGDLISDNISKASSYDGNHFHEEYLAKFDVSEENKDFTQSGVSEEAINLAQSVKSYKDLIKSVQSGEDLEKSDEYNELAQSGLFDEDLSESGESYEESNQSEFDKYDDLTESEEDIDCPESRNDDDLSEEEIIPKSAEFVDDSEDDMEESEKYDVLKKFAEEDDMAESEDSNEDDNIQKTKELIEDDEDDLDEQHLEEGHLKSHDSDQNEGLAQSILSNKNFREYVQSKKDLCGNFQWDRNCTEAMQSDEEHLAQYDESDKQLAESDKSEKVEELAQSSLSDEDHRKLDESNEDLLKSGESNKYDLTESDEDESLGEPDKDDDHCEDQIISKLDQFIEDSKDDSENDTDEFDKYDDLKKFEEDDDDHLSESVDDNKDVINPKSAEFIEDSEDDSENDTDEFDKYDDLTDSDEDDDDHLTESDEDNEDEIIPKSKEFIEDDEDDSEDETEDQRRMTEINQKWNKFYSVKSTAKKSTKSVWFSARSDMRIPVLNEVEWAEEYIAARIGPWEAFAADRDRFVQRVRKLKKEIGWVLDADHRAKIIDLLQSSATELAHTNDTSNAAPEKVSCIDEDFNLEKSDHAEDYEDLGELYMLDKEEDLAQYISFDEDLAEPDESDEKFLESDESYQIDVFSESYKNEYLAQSDADDDLSKDEIIPKSAELIEDSEDDFEDDTEKSEKYDDLTKSDLDNDTTESKYSNEDEIIPKSKEFIDDDEYDSDEQHHKHDEHLTESHESVEKESLMQLVSSDEDLREYAQSDKDLCVSTQCDRNFTEAVQSYEDDNDLAESDNSVKERAESSQSDDNLRQFDECNAYLLESDESDQIDVLSESNDEEYLTQSDNYDDLSRDEIIPKSAEFIEDDSEDDSEDDTEEFDKYDDLTESDEDVDDRLTESEDDNEDEIIPKSKEFVEDEEDDSDDETEDQRRMTEINQKWEKFYSVESSAKKSSKSVWFSARRDARIPILNEAEWAEEYIAARISPWEAFVADRDRFVQRVRKLGKEIGWVFHAAHRAKMFNLLQSNAEELAEEFLKSNEFQKYDSAKSEKDENLSEPDNDDDRCEDEIISKSAQFIGDSKDDSENDMEEFDKYDDLKESEEDADYHLCELVDGNKDEIIPKSAEFIEDSEDDSEDDASELQKYDDLTEFDEDDDDYRTKPSYQPGCNGYDHLTKPDDNEGKNISKSAEFVEDSEDNSEDETEEFDKYDNLEESHEEDDENLTESEDSNEDKIIPKSAEFVEDSTDDSEDDTCFTVLQCQADALPFINGISHASVD